MASSRPLTTLEIAHLQLLLHVRNRATSYAVDYDARLEDFVLACRENGCSVRGMAAQLGVGASTIQTWTNHARRRRAAPP